MNWDLFRELMRVVVPIAIGIGVVVGFHRAFKRKQDEEEQ